MADTKPTASDRRAVAVTDLDRPDRRAVALPSWNALRDAVAELAGLPPTVDLDRVDVDRRPLPRVRSRLPRPTLLVAGADLATLVVAASVAAVPPLAAGVFIVVGLTALTVRTARAARLNASISQVAPEVASSFSVAAIATGLVAAPARSALVAAAALAVIGSLGARAVLYAVVRALRRRGHGLAGTVIVGAGPTAVAVAQILEGRREYGLSPLGFVDDIDDDEDLPLPVIGRTSQLADVMFRTGARKVIVAFGTAHEASMVRLLRSCQELPFEVFALPRFFELGAVADGGATDDLWGFPLVRLRGSALRSFRWRLKRVFDVAVAATLLVVLAPALAATAVAVRLSSPGPILFRQERVGQFGQRIQMLKFRSMREADDPDPTWETDEDRITRVGHLLRRTRLDELPQLLNVLRGDMSIVGPRPERAKYVELFADDIPGYTDRHRFPGGITGWAQVHGLMGDDASLFDRTRFDNRYIEQWSLWRDVLILARTLPSLIGKRADGERPR